jgi:hypothetical protein
VTPIDSAFARVAEGYVAPAEPTHESAADLWCRLAAQGRVVSRHHDGGGEPYRVHLTLIEHPSLPPGQVFATFGMSGSLSVYRCLPEDAKLALRHHGSFNL